MSKEVVFSVVTINYNGGDAVENTLQSIFNQTYGKIESIIIDGGSSDCSKKIIENYATRINILVMEKDQGIYDAMNKGLKRATGDYVIFMNGGDCFYDNNVLASLAIEIKNNNYPKGLVYGGYAEVGEGMNMQVRSSRNCKYSWYGMFASHQSILYSLEVIRQNELEYDISYKIAADYKFTISFLTYAVENLQVKTYISKCDICGVSRQNQNNGMYEADRARKEVYKMSFFRRMPIISMLLSARCLKLFFTPIYNLLR